MMNAKTCSFAKSPTSVEHRREIVQSVERSTIEKLNKALEPQIRQNERERTASMNAAARCTVGGK